MKIKNKILYTYTVVVFFVLLIFGIGLYSVTSKIINDLTFNQLETASEMTVITIETYLRENIEKLKLITSRTKLRETLAHYNASPNPEDVKALNSILVDAASSSIDIERVCILGLDGKVVTSTNSSFIGRDCNGKEFFILGKEQNVTTFVEEDGEMKIFFSGPLYLKDEFLGVGLAVLKTDILNSITENREGLGETGENLVAIDDGQGNPIYINKRRFESNISGEKANEIAQPMRDVLKNKEKNNHVHYVNSTDYRGEKVIAITHYIDKAGLGVVSKIDMSQYLSSINRIVSSFGLFGGGILVVIFIVSLFVAGKISKPIVELQYGVEKIEKGNLNYKVGIPANDEIGQLSRSFDKMVEAIKKSHEEIDQKVYDQTRDIIEKQQYLENQQKATLNILEDIDKEKNVAEQLASELFKFQLAVENASDHIVITDAEGLILYANKAVEHITGFATTDIMGKKAGGKELWGGLMESAFYTLLWQTIKSDKKIFAGEVKNHRKNGELYVALASISPILDKDGVVRFFVGIERDVTKEKEIDRMKTEFISLASHQLRTPLSAMKWFGEMLLNGDAGELTKDQKEYVTNIYDSNERMIGLVNSLLNISRIESGRLVIDPKPTDIKRLIEEIIVELTPALKERELESIVSVHEHLPLISVDPKLLRQVYMNLLTNAIKYSPKGSMIQIFLSKKDDQILSQVTDMGYGIPKEEQDHVFQKFFRAKNIIKMETEGTGLGLYLVKSIIDSSGGKIWFASGEGGTTFWFSLPMSGMKAKTGEVTLEQKTIDSV